MINYSQLHNICNMGIAKFRSFGEFTPCTQHSGYTYIDNGGDILAVAHLDTVQNSRKFYKTSNKVFSPRLDDRLGAYAILRLLPLFGLKYDILLTEDEEVGMSTAQYFDTHKSYNWMFQFDRAGDDVVMYQYDNVDTWELLEKHGFDVGIGSYSDICELDSLNCTGFNFGTGYHKNHSLDAYMLIDEFETSIRKFVNFYTEYKDTYLEYDADEYYGSYYFLRDRYIYDYYLPEKTDVCPLCGQTTNKQDNEMMGKHEVCLDCANWLKLD